MNQTFRGCKRYEIVPYSGVYTMPYSDQSSRRTVFISYRIQMHDFHAAPVLWNSLPEEIRICHDINAFKSFLKTYLFNVAFN